MEELIKRMGKYFISLDRTSVEWTAAGIFKIGKKITDPGQQVKYYHGQTAMDALLKLKDALISYYKINYKIDI
jgi:hypothetical protein